MEYILLHLYYSKGIVLVAKKDTSSVQDLLEAWEATYKKGQLTLWVFLALREGEKYVDEIHAFVALRSKETIVCEEQSLYRMLRKFRDLELVGFTTRPGAGGPERKYYFLTDTGQVLLRQFSQRNIALFYDTEIRRLLFETNPVDNHTNSCL